MDGMRKDGMQLMWEEDGMAGDRPNVLFARSQGDPHNHSVPYLEVLEPPDTLDRN